MQNSSVLQTIKHVLQEIILRKKRSILMVGIFITVVMSLIQTIIQNQILFSLISLLISVSMSIVLVYITLSENDDLINNVPQVIQAIRESFFRVLQVKLLYTVFVILSIAIIIPLIIGVFSIGNMLLNFLLIAFGVICMMFIVIICEFANYSAILSSLQPMNALRNGYKKAKEYWWLSMKLYLSCFLIPLICILPLILTIDQTTTSFNPVNLGMPINKTLYWTAMLTIINLVKDFTFIQIYINSIKNNENFVQSN